MDRTSRNILIIMFMFFVFYLMKILASLILPLVLALLIALLFEPVVNYLKKKKLPNWLIMPVVSLLTLLIFFVIFDLMIRSFSQVASQQKYIVTQLNTKIDAIIVWFNNMFDLSLDTSTLVTAFKNFLTVEIWSTTAGKVAKGFGSFTGTFFMFALYYVVLLSGISGYAKFIEYVVGKNKSKNVVSQFEAVQKSIIQYVGIKTLISLGTGIAAGLICLAFGLKFALLFGFLTFMLNFIPSIGSVIATIPPVLMAIIQFESLTLIIGILILLGVLQTLMGNVVEPKIMGNKLRLNTVTVLFGLVFWGYIWGIPGMLVSVPLIVVTKLIMEQFPGLRAFSKIMGTPEKG